MFILIKRIHINSKSRETANFTELYKCSGGLAADIPRPTGQRREFKLNVFSIQWNDWYRKIITKAPHPELVTWLQRALRPHFSWFLPELDRGIRQLHAGPQWCQHPFKAWIGMLTVCREIPAMHWTQGAASGFCGLSQAKALACPERLMQRQPPVTRPCGNCSCSTCTAWWMRNASRNKDTHQVIGFFKAYKCFSLIKGHIREKSWYLIILILCFRTEGKCWL